MGNGCPIQSYTRPAQRRAICAQLPSVAIDRYTLTVDKGQSLQLTAPDKTQVVAEFDASEDSRVTGERTHVICAHSVGANVRL